MKPVSNKCNYLKMEREYIDCRDLYKHIEGLFTVLEQHLDLLQSIINNNKVARDVIQILDKTYAEHIHYKTIKDFPMENLFQRRKK